MYPPVLLESQLTLEENKNVLRLLEWNALRDSLPWTN
jgi:hypothetical protein